MLDRFKKTLWLVADDPDGSWWCDCRQGVVDAPWHNIETFPSGGSGWLWTCANCSRCFMFARAVLMRGTLETLAKRRTPRTQRCIYPDGSVSVHTLLATPDDWLELVRPLAQQLREGERYVFLDGRVLPAKTGPVKFTGVFRSHDLPELPHLSERLLEETIANPDYWAARQS